MKGLDQLFAEYRQFPAESELALWKAVKQWAFKRARNDQDLAQDIVTAAIKGHAAVIGSFSHWLSTVAKNLSATRIRRLQMTRNHGAQEIQLDGHDASLPNGLTELDFSALSPDERVLAKLILQGYSTAEIAKMQGLTAGATRKRLQRIRSRHLLNRSNN